MALLQLTFAINRLLAAFITMGFLVEASPFGIVTLAFGKLTKTLCGDRLIASLLTKTLYDSWSF